MRIFNIEESGSSIQTEITAGVTTFLTMSYIVFLNPAILKVTGMNPNGVLVATVLVCSLSSILMGLWANLPYGLAPGMGLNAFFAYTLVLGMGLSWQVALGATFISGIVFFVMTLFGIRRLIVAAIPQVLRRAIATGIGLFIAFIGLKNAGIIVDHKVTLVTHGMFSHGVAIFLIGFTITSVLVMYRYKAALLIGILSSTAIALFWGKISLPEQVFIAPDFKSVFFQADIKGALSLSMFVPIFTMLMTDMFDSIATFLGVSQVSDLRGEDGEPKNIQEALFVDSIATASAGLFGSSAGTTYIESASGVEAGGRTGLTAVVIGLLFLPFLFFGNLVTMIPGYATAPALVIVGIFMLGEIGKIDFKQFDEAIPAFLSIIMVPLTYSITQGIVWGFISYTFLKLAARKKEEIHPMMYFITLCSIAILVIEWKII